MYQDYTIAFSDCQNLQLLQQKLLRTSTVLDGYWDVARGCAEHCVGETGSKGYFAVSSHFWVFVVGSITLTVMTFALIVLVQRIWHRYLEQADDQLKT